MKNTYPYNREMPVGANFYSRLAQRVSSIIADLGYNADSAELEEVMYLVNVHLGRQPDPQRDNSLSFVSRVIFQTLRAEIDAAVVRSRRCREAAARRRAARESSLSTESAPLSVATPEPENPQPQPAPDKTAKQQPAVHAGKQRHTTPQRQCSVQRLKFRPVVNVRQRNYAKFRKK